MLKKLYRIIWVLTFIMICTPAMGQGMRPGKWWKDPQVTQKLALSDDQISKLDSAYITSRKKMIEQKSDIEKERFELQNLIEKKDIDEKAIQKQHQKVEKARSKLSSERMKFIMEVRKIIGSEKYSQLKLLFQNSYRSRYENRREHGKSK